MQKEQKSVETVPFHRISIPKNYSEYIQE